MCGCVSHCVCLEWVGVKLIGSCGGRGERGGGTRGTPGDLVEVDVLAQGLAAGVHLQDLDAALHVGAVHRHLPVEASRAQQGAVQHLHMPNRGQRIRWWKVRPTLSSKTSVQSEGEGCKQ